jgi:hypothetical protein
LSLPKPVIRVTSLTGVSFSKPIFLPFDPLVVSIDVQINTSPPPSPFRPTGGPGARVMPNRVGPATSFAGTGAMGRCDGRNSVWICRVLF